MRFSNLIEMKREKELLMKKFVEKSIG